MRKNMIYDKPTKYVLKTKKNALFIITYTHFYDVCLYKVTSFTRIFNMLYIWGCMNH